MKLFRIELLKKTGVRVVISLLGGSLLTVLIDVLTGKTDRLITKSNGFFILYIGFLIYIVMTARLKKYGKIK